MLCIVAALVFYPVAFPSLEIGTADIESSAVVAAAVAEPRTAGIAAMETPSALPGFRTRSELAALLGLENQNPPPPVSYLPGNTEPHPAPLANDALLAGRATPATSADPAASPAPFRVKSEGKRSRKAWYVLSVVHHGAATFDAWSTRRAIESGAGKELNPLLRPFAGSDALYVAVQAGPSLLDYLGWRMKTSRRPWAQRIWWLPQVAGTAASLASGAHNLTVVH